MFLSFPKIQITQRVNFVVWCKYKNKTAPFFVELGVESYDT